MKGRYLGQAAIHNRLQVQFRGVERHVLHALALPGVGDVYEAIGGLNDGGIRVFAGRAFEDRRGLPGFGVVRNGDVERTAAEPRVVVDEQLAAVLERDAVDAAVGVHEVHRFELRTTSRLDPWMLLAGSFLACACGREFVNRLWC